MSQIKYINLADLNLPEFEAHKQIDEKLVLEISESIKQIGVIEPIIVRKVNKHLEIVVGCIRYRATKLAGLKAIPCIEMSLEDDQAEIIKLHENVKRINLDHVDQGHTFIMLREKFGMTEDAISASVGKSTPYVSQHISLITQDSELAAAVKEGLLTFSQARELLTVKNKSQRRHFQKYCENGGATIDVLKNWIKEYHYQQPDDNPPDSDNTPPNFLHETPKEYRSCEACDKPVEIGDIRQVLYCPACHKAIKDAIFEEKHSNSKKIP
jgi:ParB family chromosome partitioning protein